MVTGGAGFFGGFVVEELRRRGATTVFVPRSADYNLVLTLARESRGEDEEGYRQEFISMVERARSLTGGGETVSR